MDAFSELESEWNAREDYRRQMMAEHWDYYPDGEYVPNPYDHASKELAQANIEHVAWMEAQNDAAPDDAFPFDPYADPAYNGSDR